MQVFQQSIIVSKWFFRHFSFVYSLKPPRRALQSLVHGLVALNIQCIWVNPDCPKVIDEIEGVSVDRPDLRAIAKGTTRKGAR